MDVKGNSGEGLGRKESCRESYHFREYVYHYEQNVSRNKNNKVDSGEISSGNEEHAIGNWRKHNPGNKVGSNLTEFCSRILGKEERDESGYLDT